MMRRWLSIAALFGAFGSAPALAEGNGSYLSGGWGISRGEDSCSMHMSFEGPGETEFILEKDSGGQLVTLIENDNWSAKEGDRYVVNYHVNGSVYTDDAAIGTNSNGKGGFVSGQPAEFEKDLGKGASLLVYLGSQLVTNLSLKGTRVALDSVNQCLVVVKKQLALKAKDEKRWNGFPTDPFAKLPPDAVSGLRKNAGATPIVNPAWWTTTNDYPLRALREEREGTASYIVGVGVDGRVKSCQIIKSSGSSDLDEATCSNVVRRARFNPATDQDGKPIDGSWTGSATWIIPKD